MLSSLSTPTTNISPSKKPTSWASRWWLSSIQIATPIWWTMSFRVTTTLCAPSVSSLRALPTRFSRVARRLKTAASKRRKQEALKIAAELEAERERAAFEASEMEAASEMVQEGDEAAGVEMDYFDAGQAFPESVISAEEKEDGAVRVPKVRRKAGGRGRPLRSDEVDADEDASDSV